MGERQRTLMEELGLEDLVMEPPARGRAPLGPLVMGFVRELGPADLEAQATAGPSGPQVKTTSLQQLRDTHHSLARLIASGESQTRAAHMTGRTPQGVWVLMQDPTFLELVEYYRANKTMAYEAVHEELAGLGKAAVFELRERLETDAGGFSNPELRKLAEFALDRTLTKDSAPGRPQASSVVINIKGVVPKPKPGDGHPVLDLEVEEGPEGGP